MNGKKLGFLVVSIALMVSLLAGGLFGQSASQDNIYRYLSIFTEVFSLVRSNYVEPVEEEKLIAGAFDGLTSAIDEFSYYVPPASMSGYRDYAQPETTGVGLVVSRRFGYGYVIAPLEGSPAEKAGIEAGDFIELIDGRPTQEMALWEIRSALHGEPGSKVEISVLRGSMSKREEMSLERNRFEIPPPSLEVVEGIGVVRIPFFTAETPGQLRAVLGQASSQGVDKLIVDVRGNADGSVPAAIEAADLFLKEGTIATLTGRRAEKREWTADPAAVWEGELLVLADTSSSSGAEVFAAALSGNERGRVVGTRTFGKAIEQKFVSLPSGGGLLVTVGSYATPDEQPLRGEGLRPDVQVDQTPLLIRSEGERERELPDLILEKALSLMTASATEKRAA
ncbi:MAG: S41 family peptidase [Thermoanaerobaculia bacterium]